MIHVLIFCKIGVYIKIVKSKILFQLLKVLMKNSNINTSQRKLKTLIWISVAGVFMAVVLPSYIALRLLLFIIIVFTAIQYTTLRKDVKKKEEESMGMESKETNIEKDDEYRKKLLQEKESLEFINNLITGSYDLIPALLDMTSHKDMLASRPAFLAWLLRNVDLTKLEACNILVGNLQDSSNTYAAITNDRSLDLLQELFALEAALNIVRMNEDMTIEPSMYKEHLLDIYNNTQDIDQEFEFDTRVLKTAYGDSYKKHLKGQWATRQIISQSLETLRNTYRMSTQFNVNPHSGVCVIKMGAIPPASFSLFTSNYDKQVEFARNFAYKQTLRAAKCAFNAPAIHKVIVETHTPFKDNALLTATFYNEGEKNNLEEMQRVAIHKLSALECIYYDFDIRYDGWFEERPSSISLEDSEFIPASAYTPFNNDTKLTDTMLTSAYAKSAQDLRINAKDMLYFTFDAIKDTLGDTTQDVVSTFVRVCEVTEDEYVEASCKRCIKKLIEGQIDASNLDIIEHEFLQGSQLDKTRQIIEHMLTDLQAVQQKGEMPDMDEFIGVVAQVETLLEDIKEAKIFSDTDTDVYRWFESLASRITYNKENIDDERKVNLIPNAYYHILQSHIVFCLLTHDLDRAKGSIKELLRIAPTSVDATLISTKFFEAQSKPFRALDEPRRLISQTLDYKGSAFLLYRLAYLQWQLGDIKLATALYRKVLEWPKTSAQENAEIELEELYKENDTYRYTESKELNEYAEKKGYITLCDKGGEDTLVKLSVLALDNNLFDLCAALMINLKENGPSYGSDIFKAMMYSILPKDFKIENLN